VDRKRYGDATEVSYVGYARVNSSFVSLALKANGPPRARNAVLVVVVVAIRFSKIP